MPLQVLAKLKPKPRQWFLSPKVRAGPKGAGRVPLIRRATTTLNMILLVLGLVAMAVFGALTYVGFAHGTLNGLSGMATASGLIVGLILLVLGVHLRE
jgi:hypothetical protein